MALQTFTGRFGYPLSFQRRAVGTGCPGVQPVHGARHRLFHARGHQLAAWPPRQVPQRTRDQWQFDHLLSSAAQYVPYLAEEGSGWHLQNVTCSNSCQAYVDFLGDVARNEPLEQSVIAFAPCTVLWEWLGWKMSSCKGLSKNAYKTWIAGLGGKSPIVHQIDITSYPVQQSMKTFRAAMMHELDFFNSVSSHAPLATTTLATATSDSEGWYFLVVLVLGISLVATWAMAAWRKVKAEPLERHLLNI